MAYKTSRPFRTRDGVWIPKNFIASMCLMWRDGTAGVKFDYKGVGYYERTPPGVMKLHTYHVAPLETIPVSLSSGAAAKLVKGKPYEVYDYRNGDKNWIQVYDETGNLCTHHVSNFQEWFPAPYFTKWSLFRMWLTHKLNPDHPMREINNGQPS